MIQAYQIYEKVISEGYTVLSEEPPFIISEDWSSLTKESPLGCRFTLCVQILPSSDRSQDPHLRSFPETKALCVSGLGGFSILPEIIQKLNTQLSERRLERSGLMRFVAFVTDAASDRDYIIKFIMPVKTK